MSHRKVINRDAIYLASFDGETGEPLRSGRFRLMPESTIDTQLTGLFPPVVAINDEGRDTQPFAATNTISDVTGGLGILYQDAGGNLGRFWWATANTRHRRQVTLPLKKQSRPNGVITLDPRAGAEFNGVTYVAFDDDIYEFSDHGSGETWSSLLHSLSGGGIPQSNPVEWGARLYWFCGANGITHTDGSTWTYIAQDAVGGVVLGDILYIVTSTGTVRRALNEPPVLADFSDVVSVSDTPSGILLFADATNVNIPYVVGARTLYAVDPDTNSVTQAGPQFPPSPYALRATVLTGDNKMYLAQGMSVIAWDGDTATPVGMDLDDGVPAAWVGGVRRLLNGNLSLFALVDSAFNVVADDESDVYSGDPYRDTAARGESNTMLVSREATGWHVWATSDEPVTEATMMFLSAADGQYRLWFAWGGVPYTIDMPAGFFNPLDNPEGAFEETAEILYPIMDFGYREDGKVGLMVEIRTKRCSPDEVIKPYVDYDEAGVWYPLYNPDGTHGITTNGRHSFLLHANPIPVDNDPLQFPDEPAVGFIHDTIQVKAELERGSDETLSPAIVALIVHVLKQTHPLFGFTVHIDMSSTYNGLTPHQQSELIEELVHDNNTGLLHFAFTNQAGDFPSTGTYAVKITGYQARETPGSRNPMKKSARLSMTEVISDAAHLD